MLVFNSGTAPYPTRVIGGERANGSQVESDGSRGKKERQEGEVREGRIMIHVSTAARPISPS